MPSLQRILASLAILCLVLTSSSSPVAAQKVDAAPQKSPERIAGAQHLPNAIRIHPKVISGGLPEGDAAFAELKNLGIKTVISVDGAKPDVATAEKYGLRYVHLPHGYNGVPEDRIAELAKAVRDLDGPIYIHCHHGKHRSPTASTVACIAAGLISPTDATSNLKFAGTSDNYQGLYRAAANAKRIDDATLDALQVDFPAIAKIPPMAEAMVELDHTFDHLKLLSSNSWKPLAQSPDLDAAHEALLLREHFTEMLRLESVAKEPEAFRTMLRESESDARQLETLLRARRSTPDSDLASANAAFKRIADNCAACHRQFRDQPLK